MDYVIATHHLEAQAVACIRERREQTELPEFIGHAFEELFQRLGLLGASPAGAPFVIYHEFGPAGIDAEVCVPVGEVIPAAGRIHSRVLPEMTVARTLHVGPYDELEAAYAALSAWIALKGLESAGPFQERYLNEPTDDLPPSQYLTEIEMPITSVAVGAL